MRSYLFALIPAILACLMIMAHADEDLPELAPVVDPDTVLLLQFDGPDNSQEIIDTASHIVTVEGAAKIDTNEAGFAAGLKPKFGAAGFFVQRLGRENVTTTKLRVMDHDDWTFGKTNFTIDLWYADDGGVSGESQIIGQWQNEMNRWVLRVDPDLSVNFVVQGSPEGLLNLSTKKDVIKPDCWNHIAVTRLRTKGGSDSIKIFVNGMEQANFIKAGGFTMPDFDVNLTISDPEGAVISRGIDGHVDEIHISKGLPLGTQNFEVPKAPWAMPQPEHEQIDLNSESDVPAQF